jgi:hypothetical protein
LYYYAGIFVTALSFPIFLFYFLETLIQGDDAQLEKIIFSKFIFGSFIALILVLPVVLTLYFKRKNELESLEYFNLSIIRYALAYLMFFYGYGKIGGRFFNITYLTQDTKVGELDSFYLAWFFFGRSNVQIFIIGLMEFIPAILLLFRRTYLVAAILMFPVTANVMMVNIFNKVSPFTFIVSIIIFLGNVYLLYSRKDEIITFLKKMLGSSKKQELKKGLNIIRIAFKASVIGVMLYVLAMSVYSRFVKNHPPDYRNYNKFRGGFELQSLEINGKTVIPKIGNAYYKSIYLEPERRWNSVKTFESESSKRDIVIDWNVKSDSVKTHLKLHNDVGILAVDPNTLFSGTYKLDHDRLLVNGLQNGDTIKAVYTKKPLKEYRWFW